MQFKEATGLAPVRNSFGLLCFPELTLSLSRSSADGCPPRSAKIMNTGSIVASLFAASMFILVFVCEYRWRIRLNSWFRIEGEIIGFTDDKEDDCQHPIVEYHVDEQRREFITTYVLYCDAVGSLVTVLYDASSTKAIIYSWRNRWFLTLLYLSLAVLLIALAFLSH